MTSKSEYEIAKENVEQLKEPAIDYNAWKFVCETHKASCERFLEFLEDTFIHSKVERKKYSISEMPITYISIKDKITELKKAIEHYTKNGI